MRKTRKMEMEIGDEFFRDDSDWLQAFWSWESGELGEPGNCPLKFLEASDFKLLFQELQEVIKI